MKEKDRKKKEEEDRKKKKKEEEDLEMLPKCVELKGENG